MKVAILYIATGAYDVLWSEFYRTARENFCTGEQVHFFVFTDSALIQSTSDITALYQQNLGWPFASLYRYRVFQRISRHLTQFDRVIYFNANCLFLRPVSPEEFFGTNENLHFVACRHPAFYNSSPSDRPYERRENSTACIREEHLYVQGALMGGKPEAFLAMCRQLQTNIEADLDNGLVALWHDESHWNAFINNQYTAIQEHLHILSPSYLYPEDWEIPFDPLIQLRDKSKLFDVGSIKTGVSGFTTNDNQSGSKRLGQLLLKIGKKAKQILSNH
jgi:hypothetical protein